LNEPLLNVGGQTTLQQGFLLNVVVAGAGASLTYTKTVEQ